MSLVVILVGSLIVLGILAYFLFMIFLPEWVGITGPAAKEINAAHVEGSQSEDLDFVYPEDGGRAEKR